MSAQRRSAGGRPSVGGGLPGLGAARGGMFYPAPMYPPMFPAMPFAAAPRVTFRLRGAPHSEDYGGITLDLPETLEEFKEMCVRELGLAPGTDIRLLLTSTRGEVRSITAIRDDEIVEVEVVGAERPAPRHGYRTEAPTSAASVSARPMALPPQSAPNSSVAATPVPVQDAAFRYPSPGRSAPPPQPDPRPPSPPHFPDEPTMFEDAQQENEPRQPIRGGSPSLTPPKEARPVPKKPAERPHIALPDDRFGVRVVVRRHKDRATFRVPVDTPLNKRLLRAIPIYFKDLAGDPENIGLAVRVESGKYRQIDTGLTPRKLGWLPGQEVHVALGTNRPVATPSH